MKPIPLRKFCDLIDGKWVPNGTEPAENLARRQARNKRKQSVQKHLTGGALKQFTARKKARKARKAARKASRS